MLRILIKWVSGMFLLTIFLSSASCSGISANADGTSDDSGNSAQTAEEDADALVAEAQTLYAQISDIVGEMLALAENSADSATDESTRLANQEEIDAKIEEISALTINATFAERLILQGTQPTQIETEGCDLCTYDVMGNAWNKILDAVNALSESAQEITFTYSFLQTGTEAGLDSSNATVTAVELKDWDDASVTHDEFKEDIRRALALWEELFERVFSSENGYGHNLTVIFEDLGEETGTSTSIGGNSTYEIPGTENLGDLRYGMKEFGNLNVASPASPTGTDSDGIGDSGGEIIFGKAIDWRQDHETSSGTGNATAMWVAAHEMGHAWGLEHDMTNTEQIMNTSNSLTYAVADIFPDGLYESDSSDKHGITFIYGSSAERVEPGAFTFDDGASVDLPTVNPASLGISAVKVRTALEAESALTRLERALTTLEGYKTSVTVTR